MFSSSRSLCQITCMGIINKIRLGIESFILRNIVAEKLRKMFPQQCFPVCERFPICSGNKMFRRGNGEM